MPKPTYKQVKLMKELKRNRTWRTKQQYSTFKGQVYAGDLARAYKGLQLIKGEQA